MKYFDLVNDQDQIIGSATAAECHSNPELIHRVAHFTLVDSVNKKVLITRRSDAVAFDTGKWCFMGEHLLRGDDYQTAVFRGLEDELGFNADQGIGEKCHTIFHQPQQTEFARFFIAYYKDGNLTPNPAEVAEVRWLDLDELKKEKTSFSTMTQFWIDHANWDEIVRFTSIFTQSQHKL